MASEANATDPNLARGTALDALVDAGLAGAAAAWRPVTQDGRAHVAWRVERGEPTLLAAVGPCTDGAIDALRRRSRADALVSHEIGGRPALSRLVLDGDTIVAELVLMAPTRAAVHRLRQVADAAANRIRAAERVASALGLDVPCELLYTPEGELVCASGAGERWHAQPGFPEAVRSAVRLRSRVGFGGAAVEAACLDGRAGRHWLIRVRPGAAVRVAADAALSPRQREVCEYAAAGATAFEIAKTTGLGVETVRTHLGTAYRRLGVANRVELADALRR